MSYNTMIVLMGTSLLGAGCGLVGSFTVFRGRALIGDVLAHAALPGLCLAVLLLNRRSLTPMLAGALVTSFLAVLLMTFLRRGTRVKDDALMGTVRSVFFGAGVVLMSLIQNRSVEGSKAGLDSYILGKTAGMSAADVYLIGGVSLASLLCILLLYKEFRLASFDPGFARVQGWPALLLDNLLMVLAAVTTVIGLPAVGAVLVAALLIVPGVTMRFWTDRLGTLLVGAALIGAAIGATGTLASARFSLLPAGPIIILVGTSVFTVSLLFAPRRGLFARAASLREFRRNILQQKLLRILYDRFEAGGLPAAWFAEEAVPTMLACSPRAARSTVYEAVLSGSVEPCDEPTPGFELRLTPAGLEHASLVARGYRLWSQFLAAYPDQSGAVVDLDMRQIDELLPAEVVRELEDKLRAAGRLPQLPVDDDSSLAAGGSA